MKYDEAHNMRWSNNLRIRRTSWRSTNPQLYRDVAQQHTQATISHMVDVEEQAATDWEVVAGPRETTYCLGLLSGEMGETIAEIGSVGRFDIDTPKKLSPSYHDGQVETTRDAIERELGDVMAAIAFGDMHCVISRERVEMHMRAKLQKLLDATQRDNLGRPLAPQPPQIGEALAWRERK